MNITIDVDKCEGCGECVEACPSELFELQDGKAVVVGDPEECLDCQACVTACSTGAVTVMAA